MSDTLVLGNAVERWMTRCFQKRRWSRAWKRAATRHHWNWLAVQHLRRKDKVRIAELEDALREATSALQKAGWTNCAERAHGVLEKPNE